MESVEKEEYALVFAQRVGGWCKPMGDECGKAPLSETVNRE